MHGLFGKTSQRISPTFMAAKSCKSIGGGNANIFVYFQLSTRTLGKRSNLTSICFKGVETKPPTRSEMKEKKTQRFCKNPQTPFFWSC